MIRKILIIFSIFLIGCSTTSIQPVKQKGIQYLNNDKIKIGVNLNWGGAITYLSLSGTNDNLINNHDLGRQIQQSYYSGPRVPSHRKWKRQAKLWAWNPIQTGDVCRIPGKVIEFENTNNQIYLKSIPMQWALSNVPGDCTFENWITLEDNKVHVRCRLVNEREDKNFYKAHSQELPAVYTISRLGSQYSYTGENPFTGDKLEKIKTPPHIKKIIWAKWYATENWAANVDKKNWGVGVYKPGSYKFIGGFYKGPKNNWKQLTGPMDGPCTYISPLHKEHLDHNIVYEYTYTIIVGSLKEIRDYVYSVGKNKNRPDYIFKKDRQHWTYKGLKDQGYPIKNELHVDLKEKGSMTGPPGFWKAEDVPTLYIKAAYRSSSTYGRIYWTTRGEKKSKKKSIRFKIKPGDEYHTYKIDLSSSSDYKSIIIGLKLTPAEESGVGDYVKIKCISYTNR